MRLIDANALMEKVCGNCQRNDCVPDATDTVYGCMFSEIIDQMPTIEPEVRHGRWIPAKDVKKWISSDKLVLCTECEELNSKRSTFCPNCGARMDGGADNG